jgi:hypothetical protein
VSGAPSRGCRRKLWNYTRKGYAILEVLCVPERRRLRKMASTARRASHAHIFKQVSGFGGSPHLCARAHAP